MVAGFMVTTAALSAFVSNTATTAMMVPIALSVVSLVRRGESDDSELSKDNENLAVSLLLGIAYAASIGGIATIIGTPPNALVRGLCQFDHSGSVSYRDYVRPLVVRGAAGDLGDASHNLAIAHEDLVSRRCVGSSWWSRVDSRGTTFPRIFASWRTSHADRLSRDCRNLDRASVIGCVAMALGLGNAHAICRSDRRRNSHDRGNVTVLDPNPTQATCVRFGLVGHLQTALGHPDLVWWRVELGRCRAKKWRGRIHRKSGSPYGGLAARLFLWW